MDPPRPACLPAPQSALASVESVETLEMLEKVQYNAAVAPAEDKYRRLRLGNARIRTTLADAPGGLAALAALGWAQEIEEGSGEEVLVLPKKGASMAQVHSAVGGGGVCRRRGGVCLRGILGSDVGRLCPATALAQECAAPATQHTIHTPADRRRPPLYLPAGAHDPGGAAGWPAPRRRACTRATATAERRRTLRWDAD